MFKGMWVWSQTGSKEQVWNGVDSSFKVKG